MYFKKLFLILGLLFSTPSFATYLPNFGDYFSVGTAFYTATNLAQDLFLNCDITSGANCTFRQTGTSAGYTITGGKTLKCFSLQIYNASTGTPENHKFGCSTNDVGYGTATALTGFGTTIDIYSPDSANYETYNPTISCPSSTFLSVQGSGSFARSFLMVCREF